jgi:hypothetical protein
MLEEKTGIRMSQMTSASTRRMNKKRRTSWRIMPTLKMTSSWCILDGWVKGGGRWWWRGGVGGRQWQRGQGKTMSHRKQRGHDDDDTEGTLKKNWKK